MNAETPPAAPARWADRRFHQFWAAQSISQFGDRITELALPLIAVGLLAATPNQIGLLNAAVWLPYLVSFFVGSWVDRRQHKRRVLVAADLARAAVLVSLPIGYLLHVVTLPQVFAVALLNGFGEVFFNTASASVFVNLVPRESYLQANSNLSTTRSASFIAGPALGGLLIQVLTAPIAVLADALSFVTSGYLLARIPLTENRPGPNEVGGSDETARTRRRALEGLSFLAHHRYLRASLACAATVNFFSLMASTLIVLFANRALGLPGGLIGLAFGLGAVGGLLGALAAPRLARRFGIGAIIVVGAVVYPAAFAIAAFAS